MSILEVSLLHHVAIVFLSLWLLSIFNYGHPIAYFCSLAYLYLVHETFAVRLRKKLQFEERKNAHQKRLLSDSETVRWLNHAIERIWPVCMEQIVSQTVLLPIVPWFLEKYKPWTAKKVVMQQMYLGRTPPLFTDIRVLSQNSSDDHLVLEMGMNFCSADDMSTMLSVQLRKRLGFGMWTNLHITGMHIEGKVLVGFKFLRNWPFVSRLRVCFVEPPYFQMTVKPIFNRGIDVTEVPGIAGWLDKLLSVAFEQTLVQPNVLVVDLEKFASSQQGDWFTVDEKEPVAHVLVEVLEGSDMKPSDLNGLSDPYVKGKLGTHKFKTSIQRRTLAPKWHEQFKIPIASWDLPNLLFIEVFDKDQVFDDALGDCTVDINDIRNGERNDMWIPLENIKMGRIHLAITVVSEDVKKSAEGGTWEMEEEDDEKGDLKEALPRKSPKVADNLESIDIQGQEKSGIWVHRPGTEVSQTWEQRKGRSNRFDTTQIIGENVISSPADEGESQRENSEGMRKRNKVKKGLKKLGSFFVRNKEEEENDKEDEMPSPFTDSSRMSGVKWEGVTRSPSVDEGDEKASRVLKKPSSIKYTMSMKSSTNSSYDEPLLKVQNPVLPPSPFAGKQSS